MAKPLEMGNSYIKRLISFDKRQEAAGMDKGTDVYISMLALNTPCVISIWMLCLVGFACTKIFRVNIWAVIFGNEVLFISFLIVTGGLGYYINEIFLFKKDKYRKYFTEFEKKKKVSALLRHLCRFYDYTSGDFLSVT